MELKGIEILFFAVSWILFAVFIAITAASAVLRWFFPSHRFPWLEACVFLPVALGIAGPKLWAAKRKLDRLKPGRRGERYVAAKLEELRPLGCLVLHDLPPATTEKDKHFNIDHVLVGPAGVFAIETKTWSKPIGENPKRIEAVLKTRPQLLTKQEISFAHAQLQAHGRAAMQAKA